MGEQPQAGNVPVTVRCSEQETAAGRGENDLIFCFHLSVQANAVTSHSSRGGGEEEGACSSQGSHAAWLQACLEQED